MNGRIADATVMSGTAHHLAVGFVALARPEIFMEINRPLAGARRREA